MNGQQRSFCSEKWNIVLLIFQHRKSSSAAPTPFFIHWLVPQRIEGDNTSITIEGLTSSNEMRVKTKISNQCFIRHELSRYWAVLSHPPLALPSPLKLAASDSGSPPLALSQPYLSGLILFAVPPHPSPAAILPNLASAPQSCWSRPVSIASRSTTI